MRHSLIRNRTLAAPCFNRHLAVDSTPRLVNTLHESWEGGGEVTGGVKGEHA